MRQLLLLRHAKSSWSDASLADHERPLDEQGRAAAAAMGRALHYRGLAPDMVLVSTARRTVQTLEALEPWDDTPLIEPMAKLYLASCGQLLAALNGVAETVRSVMLIAHNPGLHDLALTLTGPHAMTLDPAATRRLAQGYPAGALAEFTIAGRWGDLGPGGGRLVRFLCPKDLPEMAS
jgi:phosphohistidine phosphatase